MMIGQGRPRGGGEGHPAASANRPGTGNRPTISADLGAQPVASRPASSRRAIASVMRRAIARISSGPKPRVVVAGVPSRMPEAVFGGSGSNGIAFLLTVIPISSRSVLGLLAGHAERA